MADYRQFCHSCNNEIGFGSHRSGCPVVAAARAAEKEFHDFESELRKAVDDLTDDELLEELVKGSEKIGYLDDALRAEEKRFKYLRQSYLYRMPMTEGREKLKEKNLWR